MGYVVFILKIVIPLIIIIFGVMDLAKAIVADDEKVIKKQTIKLSKRIALGVAIFFIPTLINYIFSLVGEFSQTIKEKQEICFNCVIYPNKCDTSYKGEIFTSK